MLDENQPQPDETDVEEQTGAEEPQSEPEAEETQDGAEEVKGEKETPKKERTYTQEEWAKRESELNKQTETLRQQLAKASLDKEIEKQQEAEKAALAKDKEAVDSGLITEDEARKRRELREQETKTQKQLLEAQQVYQRLSAEAERQGKLLAAQDFGRQYTLNEEEIAELLKDESIKTPSDMKAKAADLAIERLQGEMKKSSKSPPKYDKGTTSDTGGSIPTTSKELIKSGWEEKARKKK
jgi:hypothetical protein